MHDLGLLHVLVLHASAACAAAVGCVRVRCPQDTEDCCADTKTAYEDWRNGDGVMGGVAMV